ncbi:MAG: excinuclease [Candidatus Methanogaster sp.]|uniref:Excinuclease n=1 Tax=Candidatus Methanogaster sp. TaxID=3386292 RepID=A0AC61L0G3_9EURY|nr:MAG: excinuclease [ANME-2 cluster archaeon]
MRLKKITVTNLFGMFCHEVPLNMDDHITIIHGPNGIGKTILLTLLDALFGPQEEYYKLRRIPFSELSMDFDDGSTLCMERRIVLKHPTLLDTIDGERNRAGNAIKLLLKFSTRGSDEKSYEVPSIRREGITFSLERICSRIPELERMDSETWIYVPTQEKLLLEDVLDRFGDRLPSGGGHKKGMDENEPEWLKKVRNSIHIHFIETQRLDTTRLFSFSDSRRLRRSEESYHTIPTVIDYSKELADAIREKLAEYAELSQSLDRTFPTRLVKGNDSSNPTIEELRDDFSKLEEKRSRLMAAGLLDRGEEIDFKEFQEIDESDINVLSVYVHDVKEKLEVLDELTDKIDLLVNIINSRFLYKKMSISKKEGFIFETSDKQSISPTDLSSGEQHELVLNYELLFKVNPNSLILIDEPELSLHVIWQQQFIRDLQEIIKLAGFDVLLATHAPDIIHDRWDLTVELGGFTK